MSKSKLIVLFLITSLFSSLFTNAQNSRVNLSNKNEQLKDIIEEIEKQTNYLFVYNASDVDVTKRTSLEVKDEPVEHVLAAVFKSNDIDYRIKGNNIMLVESKVSQQSEKKEITGVVVDEADQPLIGASVVIKGTTTGSMTDLDGKFKLSVSPGDVLQVSYIGYTEQEIPVTAANSYDVKLLPNAITMSDVVVTALGIKRSEKALSYNAQLVGQDELTTVKDANFINALTGKVAGVTINASAGGVGAASKVVMRGTKSITGSNNAMYVIDGVPMYNTANVEGEKEFGSRGGTDPASDLNPDDIESLTVLNGAAASALYGSHAANGVIMITTKKGKAGKTNITFSQNTEFMSPFVLPKFQNSYGTGSRGVTNNASDMSWGEKLYGENFTGYEPKDYFQTGVVTTEALTLSTGNDINQTFFSASAVNSEGYIPNNTYDRYNFTIRNSASMLNNKMKLELGASYIKQKDNNMTTQGLYFNPLVPVYLFPRGGDWNDVRNYEQWNTADLIYDQRWGYGLSNYEAQNPYWINNRNLRTNTKDRYTFDVGLTYNVLDWLSLVGRAKTDYTATKYQEKLWATTIETLAESNNGYYGLELIRDRQSYADFLANVNTNFMDQKITLNATLGTSISDQFHESVINRGGLDADAIPNVFNIMQIDRNRLKAYQEKYQDQTQAIFASAEVGYLGTYYLTLTGRNEWPSQLAGPSSSKSSFFYPSVGTSIVLSEVIKMPSQIDYLKFRGSYASVASPFQRFLAQKYHSWNDKTNSYNPNYDHYPIDNLEPERTNSWEVGLTARFLQDFNLDVTLYTAKTHNQVYEANISATSGYNKFYIQSGSVTNKGIELSLGYKKTLDALTWSSNYVLTVNKNRINDLIGDWKHPITGEPYPEDELKINALGGTQFILRKGGSLGDLYSIYDLRRDDNGNIYVDADGKVHKENISDDPIKLGSVLPKANMSWRNDFYWNNFNFGFMIGARLGGIVYSTTQATMDYQGVSEASLKARELGGVLINNGADLVNAENWYTEVGGTTNVAQYYTYNATNVRLQEVSVGYTFAKSKLWNVADLTVSFVGRNLLMIYNKAPFDPESVASMGNNYQGIDYFLMPSNRSLGFNVKMNF